MQLNLTWFKRIGMLFVPVNVSGWVILLAAIVYAVYVFIDIDSRSDSVSDTLMNFVFNLVIIGVVYSLVGLLTSRGVNKDYENCWQRLLPRKGMRVLQPLTLRSELRVQIAERRDCP